MGEVASKTHVSTWRESWSQAWNRWLLYNPLPLVGGWLRRRAAASLARQGTPQAAGQLAEALVRTGDGQVQSIARQALENLRDAAEIDAVCRVWADTRQAALAEIIAARQWLPSAPLDLHVLTALAMSRRAVLTGRGPEVVAPLIAAMRDPQEAIRREAAFALTELTDPEARLELADRLCAAWAESRSTALESIMVRGRHVASQPLPVRVLSALKTDRANLLTKLGAEVVEPLLAAHGDHDPQIAERAAKALRSLQGRAAQSAVCRLVIERDDSLARTIAAEADYAPEDERERAVYYFLTRQWQRYDDLDFERRLLSAVYAAADADLKRRIVETVRHSGRTDYLIVISGGDRRSRIEVMTPAESEFIIQMLAGNQEFARLWSLAMELPFLAGVQVVRILAAASWQPERPDERAALQELSALVAGELPLSISEITQHVPPALMRATARVSGRVSDVAFAPSRPWLAIGGKQQLVVWDFQSGQPHQVYRGFARSVGPVAFIDDGVVCAEGLQSGRESVLHAWRNGDRVKVVQPDMVTSLSAAGGMRVLVTRRDEQALLWDAATQTTIAAQSLGFWPRGARVSSDGSQALLVHQGVALVTLPDLAVAAETSARIGGVSKCAAFAPDGKSHIIGNFRGDAHVTTCQGDRLAVRRRKLAQCSGEVQGIEVLERERVIILAGSQGRVDFLSWDNESLVGSIHTTGQRLTSLHVSPGGDFMALGDSDSTMSFWDLRVLQIPVLFSLPLIKARPAHLAAVGAWAAGGQLPAPVQRAVAFTERVLRHRFRYDIEIDEIQTIRAGEFDIAID
jgi:HEAT repeat protein